METPDEGQVFLEGKDVTGLEPHLRHVNTVFQNYALFPHMNVAKNIAYGLRIARVPKEEIRTRVKEALELVQLQGYENRMPGELSGGQRQRVAIARAIINNPKVLLLDEPLGALDLQLRKQMQLELKHLQKKLGITFIYITHDQEEAVNMSDRIVVMRDGLFVQIGTPDEIYNHPINTYVAKFVGDANIVTENGITIAVRSQNILIDSDVNATGRAATILEKRYAANMMHLTLRLDSGEEIVSSHPGTDQRLTEGMQVRVSWRKEDAMVVADDEKNADSAEQEQR